MEKDRDEDIYSEADEETTIQGEKMQGNRQDKIMDRTTTNERRNRHDLGEGGGEVVIDRESMPEKTDTKQTHINARKMHTRRTREA